MELDGLGPGGVLEDGEHGGQGSSEVHDIEGHGDVDHRQRRAGHSGGGWKQRRVAQRVVELGGLPKSWHHISVSLSFSLSSKPSSSSCPSPSKHPKEIHNGGGKVEDGEPKPQFVTIFDPAQALDAQAKLIIPLIPNANLRPTKKMKNLPLPTTANDLSTVAASKTCFVLDTSTSDSPTSNIPYGLTLHSNSIAASTNSRFQEEDGDHRRTTLVDNSIFKRVRPMFGWCLGLSGQGSSLCLSRSGPSQRETQAQPKN